ncbi:efflux transporter, RND family, MFP subunit [Gottschalkia purinilytica]|uniref:Efflux transporter, RND family, MFP subunit n=1 Tax=Gottschalkia purinilytica TaxID=1503 RepID=A0A0L0WDR5_GOTPU|nr:efflux RND transporter periplasmic adaptor subunit [Gottschalkia purinilytica]KNF09618.1 efflux transporter, RND family, MFP subunit [Gottschalkia purinilytica]
MDNKKKFLTIVSVLIIIAGIVSIGAMKAPKKVKNPNEEFETVKVLKEKNFSSTLDLNGVLKSKNEANVISELPYPISEVLVKEGDVVTKGKILARLNSEELKAKLKSAELSLELEKKKLRSLEKSLENAKNTANSQKNINKDMQNGMSSSIETQSKEDIESNIELQKKTIEIQEINLNTQREAFDKSNIKSPINGTVVFSGAKVGVPATGNNPLFTISDTKDLEVEVNVKEYDIRNVKIDQVAKITGEAFKDKEIYGKVTYIAPRARVSNSGAQGTSREAHVLVKISLENTDDILKPGYTTNVSIDIASKDEALVVPYEAIYQKKNGSYVVYVIRGNKIEETNVDIGISGDINQEIISKKIKAGDKIILNPSEKVRNKATK